MACPISLRLCRDLFSEDPHASALGSQLLLINAKTHLHCNTIMDLFNEEFNELVRPSARQPGFTLGNLHGRLQEHPFATPFDEPEEEETMVVFRLRLTDTLKQMMYVSGETAEPSHETTGMVEEIVRQQVIEMVREHSIYFPRSVPRRTAAKQSSKDEGGTRSITTITTWKSMLMYSSCAPAPKTQLDVVANPLPPTT
jgi:hypothetical protein